MIEENWPTEYRLTYVDREGPLQALREFLLHERQRIADLKGAAGTGKTLLARRFADQARQYLPGGVLFFSGPGKRRQIPEVVERISSSKGRKLLVFDGIDEEIPPRNWIREFLLSLQRAHSDLYIIATSRPTEIKFDYGLELAPFSRSEAKEYLQKLSFLHGEVPGELFDLAEGNFRILNQLVEVAKSRGDFIEALAALSSFQRPGLLGPDGRPLDRKGRGTGAIIADVRNANEELLKRLQIAPEEVFLLSPRQFEETAAELFKRLGYQVTLTPASKDGGVDLYLAKKEALGSFLYYVECKLYSPERPVGVAIVNALTGVVERGRATAGLLLTTSRYTRGARAIERELQHRLSLKDYSDFKTLLAQISQ